MAYVIGELLFGTIDFPPLDGLAYAIGVCLALGVTLEYVVALATDAAPAEAFEVVVAKVHLGLVAVETGPWIYA